MVEEFYAALCHIGTRLRPYVARQEGQALVEYALILSLIAVVAIGVLVATGQNVTAILSSIENAL